jgi:UPF0271 protein
VAIELNADIGEGDVGSDDAGLMPWIGRASIACGGHAGDEHSMAAAVELARAHGVQVGAHPGYPDRDGFGRRAMVASGDDIRRWVTQQTQALLKVCARLGVRMAHVKPHGALYNTAACDADVARAVAEAVRALAPWLALVALAGSNLARAGREAGLTVLEEAFADRRYCADGALVSRETPGALIDDPARACAQALAIAAGRAIETLEGGRLRLRADTLCVHGDTPGAVAMARAIAQALGGAEPRSSG